MKNLALILVCCLIVFTACAQKPTADIVLQKVITASGGAEKLASINDQTWKCDFTMHVMPPGMPAEAQEGTEEGEEAAVEKTEETAPMAAQAMPMTITYKRPDKLRFDTMDPAGNVVFSQCYDGTKGWTTQMGQTMEMTGGQLDEYVAMAETWVDGLANYKAKGYEVVLLPDEMVDDHKCYVLQATGKTGKPQKYYINQETNLVEKQTGEMTNMEGQWEVMSMTFKNYKMADSVNVAVAQNVALLKEDGTLIWEAAMTEVLNNSGVEDAVFAPKEMTTLKE